MADRPRILGAVIAGGESRRFGSDKAIALVDGRPMIAHIIAALGRQVDMIVTCGRAWPDMTMVADLRDGRIGPLGGIEAALDFAVRNGFGGVLSAPVDTLPLPLNLAALLVGQQPAVFQHQYLIGYWPVSCRALIGDYIDSGGRSVRSWVERMSARLVAEPFAIANINRPGDLVAGKRWV